MLATAHVRREKDTHSVCDCTAHGCNEGHGSAVTVLDHLLGHCLGSHEYPRHVDLKHGVRVLGRVLQGRGFLLDPCCSNQAIHSALDIGDLLNGAGQQFRVTHINTTIVQLRPQFLLGSLLNLEELGGLSPSSMVRQDAP